ncbi:MAG TPA: hypothetical protein DEH78_31910 [Solibacterales bacterium]|nr:hypothetical protein [Bryobacterales bacterium]
MTGFAGGSTARVSAGGTLPRATVVSCPAASAPTAHRIAAQGTVLMETMAGLPFPSTISATGCGDNGVAGQVM